MKTARHNQHQANFMKQGKRKSPNLVPRLLVIFGLLLMISVIGIKLYSDIMRKMLLKQYEQTAVFPISLADSPEATPTPSVTAQWSSDVEPILPDPSQLSVSDGGEEETSSNVVVIGKLQIPKLDLDVAISEGVSSRMLRYSVGHFTGTALPGDIGNCAITGHRNYLWGEFFNRLDEIFPGDEIILTRDGSTYTYIVSDKFVVEPDELWVLNQGQAKELTLITCTPIRVATHRLIVKAELRE
jgi:sortase A